MATLYICGAGNPEGVRLAQGINNKEARWEQIVILDDDPAKRGYSFLGVGVAGSFDMLEHARSQSTEVANLVARTTSRRWSARCRIHQYGFPFATLIDPGVDIAGAELARDLIVYQNATIGPEVSIGEGSVIFMGAAIGHESRLGECCVVAPHAVINARVELGDGVYVGPNATILPEVKVGPWATIGAGSVAMRDVPAGATVLGVPGKVVYVLNQMPPRTEGGRPLPVAGREAPEDQV
jgi:sugar O-acyltransferase (sialic acid O-acetyltransferase NeuD family)